MSTLVLVDADTAATVSTAGHDGQRVTLVAGLFGGIDSCWTRSAQNVKPMSHRFQVSWVDAASDPAQMVQLGVFRDRSVHQLVHHSMGSQKTSGHPVISAVTPDHSVARIVSHPGPQPAVIGLVDSGPASFYQRHSLGSHAHSVTMDGNL